MHDRISLNGPGWRCKGFLDEAWRQEGATDPHLSESFGWHEAGVPGSVQHDLWRAGVAPNPYFELNSLALEWIPQRSWVYRKTFSVPKMHDGKRIRLCLEGLDYEAQVFLNGEKLGTHRSQFTPARFEVADKLMYSENLLAVVLAPAPPLPSQAGRTSQARHPKTRMSYGWDFCPRLVHVGIWDEVYLEVTGAVRLEEVWVRPLLSDDLQEADVSVAVALSSGEAREVAVETQVHFQGKELVARTSTETLDQSLRTLNFSLPLPRPDLWWPNGHGAPSLYALELRLGGVATRRVSFGVRRLAWTTNDTPDASARPYTVVVNNRNIDLKGWNWVPLDALYGVPRPTKLKRLLTLAQKADVNLLRVNGVGLIETEAFYNLCDRLGLMVWQEFIQSSSAIDRKPPEDAAYIEQMVLEAESVVPRKRNHPSLIIWGGGNELESLAFLPLDDDEPVIGALRETVARLDPDRLWLPTSATGPMPYCGINTATSHPFTLHDVHGPWHHQGLVEQYTLFNRSRSLLHSEFGAEGVTNLATLQAVVAAENRFPVSLENPAWRHLGGVWWLKKEIWESMVGKIEDLEVLTQATQTLQAEGVRYAVEANRRRSENSGSLPWMFNEPYPMLVGTAAVDYYARPKPLYYAVARAYAAVSLTARFDRQVWAGHSAFSAEVWAVATPMLAENDLRLSARLVGASGHVYHDETDAARLLPDSATKLADIVCSLSEVEAVFFLDLALTDTRGDTLAANRYPFSRTENLAVWRTLPQTKLELTHTETGFVVANPGAHAALFVWVEDARPVEATGGVYIGDNHFCLLPGEARRLAVAWTCVPDRERHLQVAAWNTEAAEVRGNV